MSTLVAVLVLAVGTYAFRVAGPLLHTRVTPSTRVKTLMTRVAVVLLLALAASAATVEGTGFAGFARPAGVLVAGVLAGRRMLAGRNVPFVVVVLAAAGTAAGLRLLGVR